jgi:hypothetical protein
MKTPLFALLVLAAGWPLQADILVNGNFADGRAHWKGDAENVDTSNDLASPSNQGSVTITLKKDKWTKIYQTFSTHEKRVDYSITFTLSSDYHVDADETSGGAMGPSPGLDDIDGMYPLYLFANANTWTLIVREIGARGSSYIYLQPDVKKTDAQTLTGKIQGMTETADKILLLAFPPGEGTITLTNISLTPEDP